MDAALAPDAAPVVTAAAPGGLFLVPKAVADAGVTNTTIAAALRGFRDEGARVFADAFPSFAVSLARFS